MSVDSIRMHFRGLAASGLCLLTLSLAGCSGGSDQAMAPAPNQDAELSEAGPDIGATDLEIEEEPVTEPPPESFSAAPAAPAAPLSSAIPERSTTFEPITPDNVPRSLAVEPFAAPDEFAVPPDAESAVPAPEPDLPAGSTRTSGDGFATVAVFYATDRQAAPGSLAETNFSAAVPVVPLLVGIAVFFAALAFFALLRSRPRSSLILATATCAAGGLAGACAMTTNTQIEKQGVVYSAQRGPLVRGICEVTVPDSHQRGRVERPSLLRFEIHEDQEKHVVLTSAVELPEDEFHARLASLTEQSPERDLLVFVHGYNVDFESAIQRTAQLAVDLPFRGVPVCYSWPSQGGLLSYTVDENNAAWTVSHLKQFLLELSEQSGADTINLVAHSMGNRALTSALSELYLEYRDEAPVFDSVVLAAPDVDADYFRRDLAPRLLETAAHVTLYASSDDRALIASKQVHGYPRAGESGSELVVVPGIETIDVSGIDLSLLGHSYYGDSQHILRDLFDLVDRRLPASQRPWLVPQPLGQLVYYQLATRTASRPTE